MPLFDVGARAGPEVVTDRVLTVPNLLSLVRLAALPFVYLDLTGGRWLRAFIVLAIISWTDFFDGYIARRFNQVSRVGKLFDPISDRVLVAVVGIAMIVANILPLWVVVALLVRDVVVLAGGAVLLARGLPPPPVTRLGKVATFGIMSGLGFVLSRYAFDVEAFGVIGFVLIAACGVLYYAAAGQYLVVGVRELRAVPQRAE